MCVAADLPIAVVPLWHVAHPEVTAGCTNLAPRNDEVDVWQVSQAAAVTTCVADLPVASLPLWQVEQPDVIVVFL